MCISVSLLIDTKSKVCSLGIIRTCPLLSGFISKKNQRAFKAFLVVKSNGNIAFEFQAKKDDEGKEADGAVKEEVAPKKATRKTAVKKVAS